MAGEELYLSEALALSQVKNKESLYDAANEIRMHFMGNHMDTCSIVNARSGKCTEDCKWCSQSKYHNTSIDEYELVDIEFAKQQAKENTEKGVNRFSLVTSGRKISTSNLKKLADVYSQIKQSSPIHLCASMGLLNKEELEVLKSAGVEHYHCNIETAPSYFSQLVTTHTMEEKIKTIKLAQEMGLSVCSGGIIGMGETMEQRIEMAFTLKNLGVKSIPLNILMPVKGTKLESFPPLSDVETLTTFALFRFINPQAYIRFAGGRKQIAHIQEKAMASGVNAALVGDYLTTTGTNIMEDKEMFEKLGFSMGENSCLKGSESIKE